MSSKNEIYVNRDPLSAGPYSCSIQINESVLLTPNITSSKALLKILEKILGRIKAVSYTHLTLPTTPYV